MLTVGKAIRVILRFAALLLVVASLFAVPLPAEAHCYSTCDYRCSAFGPCSWVCDEAEGGEWGVTDHHPNARSIPLQELALRASGELTKASPVVLDCSRVKPTACSSAADRLFARGFPRVFAVTGR